MKTLEFHPAHPITAQLRSNDLPLHLPGSETMLYRFIDRAGRLMYVGVTVNPQARWQAHRRRAAWWPLVHSVSVESYPYMNAALDAELEAIATEAPRFNVRSASGTAPESNQRGSAATRIGKGRGRDRRGMEGIATATNTVVSVVEVVVSGSVLLPVRDDVESGAAR